MAWGGFLCLAGLVLQGPMKSVCFPKIPFYFFLNSVFFHLNFSEFRFLSHLNFSGLLFNGAIKFY